jgi:hypothetical protein
MDTGIKMTWMSGYSVLEIAEVLRRFGCLHALALTPMLGMTSRPTYAPNLEQPTYALLVDISVPSCLLDMRSPMATMY